MVIMAVFATNHSTVLGAGLAVLGLSASRYNFCYKLFSCDFPIDHLDQALAGHFMKSCPVCSLCIAIPSEQNRGERLQCCASLPISMITSFMRPLASHADVLRGWSRVPACERLLNRKINSFRIIHKYQLEITCRLWEIQSALLMSKC